MNSSFLYHAWGLYQHKCLREEYKGNTILLHIESKQAPKRCPKCCHLHLVKNGFRTREFVSIGRVQYNIEKYINKRKVLKGTRYLLLHNGADIFDKEYRTRPGNALDMNKPLSQAYYLKEQLREIWSQSNKQAAEKIMLDWVKQEQESKVPQLMKTAVTILAYRTGILAWYDCFISTTKVEGN